MVNLRPYQKQAIETIKETFKSKNKQYVEMPTGSGKTITFLSYAHDNHENILIVVPSREILKQVYGSALIFFGKQDISRKGGEYSENIRKVHICIVNNLRSEYLKNIQLFPFDLIIIDEAHHIQAPTYKKFIECFEDRCKILGVTATPNRTDGLLISKLLEEKSFCIGIEELIKNGFLCDIEGYRVKTNIDISDIEHHNGDFSIRKLYQKLCTDSRNEIILDVFLKHLSGRKTIIFCVNLDHSKSIMKLFRKNGISIAHIDGKMNLYERENILSDFKNGQISCITNCQLLSEGFDEPSIDGVIIARPTTSQSLFSQMVGRGLRLYPGKKNCKIIDVVDNAKYLCGFTSLISDGELRQKDYVSGIFDLRNHVSKVILEKMETTIERTDIFKQNIIDEKDATSSQINTLDFLNIQYFEPISFKEASFLIWFHELKKQINGST